MVHEAAEYTGKSEGTVGGDCPETSCWISIDESQNVLKDGSTT